MRSPGRALRRAVRNRAPVSYAAKRSGFSFGPQVRNDTVAQLAAQGTVGTLFSIVNRTSSAVAQVNWRLWRKAESGLKEDRVEVSRHAALDLWNRPATIPMRRGGRKTIYHRQSFCETVEQHLDLVGETCWVVERDPRSPIPLGMWPVRPDRMEPIPSAEHYLAGWVYTGPDGEKVPLEVDEVIQVKMPNAMDPYRGMGPVQAIMTDLDSVRYSAEWNRNFFVNSAEPGGVVEVNSRLSDDQFAEMRARWREQHRGVANAHRVAILEAGAKWVERKFTQRDMQFVELRNASREIIREAFGVSKTMLGQSEDVNRATAQAAEYVFERWVVRDRLERLKAALNFDLLPMFGGPAEGLEFDYDPAPDDAEEENAGRDSKVAGTVALVEAGYDPVEVLEVMGLPEITWIGAADEDGEDEDEEPTFPLALPAGPEDRRRRRTPAATDRGALEAAFIARALEARRAAAPVPQAGPRGRTANHHRTPGSVLPERGDDDPPDLDPDALPDVSHLQESWSEALERLLDRWGDIEDAQKAALVDAVRDVAELGDLAELADLAVDNGDAAEALWESMVQLADEAAVQVVAEAAGQGVDVEPDMVAGDLLYEVADVVTTVRAAQLAAGAALEAIRVSGPAVTADEIAHQVEWHLRGLSPDGPRPLLGGALTGAQNSGRIGTMAKSPPEGALYGNEKNDGNTCGPCREVDGRWLGNVSDLDQVMLSYPGGAFGGYAFCLGRHRCRGTISGVWRPTTTSGGREERLEGDELQRRLDDAERDLAERRERENADAQAEAERQRQADEDAVAEAEAQRQAEWEAEVRRRVEEATRERQERQEREDQRRADEEAAEQRAAEQDAAREAAEAERLERERQQAEEDARRRREAEQEAAEATPVDPRPDVGPDSPLEDVMVHIEETAWLALQESGEPQGSWVLLAKVWAPLRDAGVPKDRYEQAIRTLRREPGVFTSPESDLKRITPEDQEAAVVFSGDEPNHMIAFERLPPSQQAATEGDEDEAARRRQEEQERRAAEEAAAEQRAAEADAAREAAEAERLERERAAAPPGPFDPRTFLADDGDLDQEAARSWIADNWATWRDGLTDEQAKAVRNYVGNGFMRVNAFLRDVETDYGDRVEEEAVRDRIDLLDAAFDVDGAVLPEDVSLWRGVVGDFGRQLRDADEAGQLVGSTITDPAFFSTSLHGDNAQSATGGGTGWAARFEVRARAGQRALGPAPYRNALDSELEVILPRGTSFRVVDTRLVEATETTAEYLHVAVEVVDADVPSDS